MVLQLNLSGNELCGLDNDGCGTYNAEGITAIADALRVNGSLTVLILWRNDLKDEGVSAICEAIQSNKETKLASLNFGDNGIGPVGATAVAAMVAVTGSLTKMRYVTPQTKSEFGSDWTHIDIRGASDARLLVHVARVRVRVLRTCVMQPSVGLLSAFPHAACAAKERSFLTYPAIDTPYCSLQPDDAPSVTLCLCALCSLDHNCLDEEAKQALRNAWRGAPSQLEL